MKYFLAVVCAAAFAHAVVKLAVKDYGSALGLFGGACAWLMVTLREWGY